MTDVLLFPSVNMSNLSPSFIHISPQASVHSAVKPIRQQVTMYRSRSPPSINHIGPVIDGFILHPRPAGHTAKTGHNFMQSSKITPWGGGDPFFTGLFTQQACIIADKIEFFAIVTQKHFSHAEC
jgi:hypothetical protein